MEFWLISDGEKEGPILDFELRSRIRGKEVTADQKVWYSELEKWTPIGELELFANEFTADAVNEDNVEDYLSQLDKDLADGKSNAPTPPPIPPEIHLWRRFGARWFDYLAYLALFHIWIVWADVDLKALAQRSLFPIVFVMPWIFFEAVALHFWGTTLGKWLTGLKVRTVEAQKLTAGKALLRTVRVMILGMGFAQPFLIIICHLLASWFATKKKIVLWDSSAGIRLERAKETPQKWIAFAVGIFFSFSVLMWAAYQIAPSLMTPEKRAEFEKMQQQMEQALESEKN